MKKQLQKMRSALIHGYSFPVVLSLALHSILLVAVVVSWDTNQTMKMAPPVYMSAALVELPKARPKPAPDPMIDRQAHKRAEQKKAAEERRQEEARKEQLARKQEQQRQKEQRQKEQRQKEQREKELALKREKEALDKARKEKEARQAAEREKELKQKQDAEKRRKQEDRRKKQEMLDRLERERQQQEMQAAAESEHKQQRVAQYSALIKSLASQYWNRPPSARNNMVAKVRISLSPFGDLLDVALVQGSGNDEFDRSVIQAVKNAAPFPEFKKLERGIFDEYFRRITIRFRPEDLVR